MLLNSQWDRSCLSSQQVFDGTEGGSLERRDRELCRSRDGLWFVRVWLIVSDVIFWPSVASVVLHLLCGWSTGFSPENRRPPPRQHRHWSGPSHSDGRRQTSGLCLKDEPNTWRNGPLGTDLKELSSLWNRRVLADVNQDPPHLLHVNSSSSSPEENSQNVSERFLCLGHSLLAWHRTQNLHLIKPLLPLFKTN